jgi:hypothetical protein
MTRAQAYLLTLQLTGFLIILAYISWQLVKARQEAHKYKLYALRDRLLYLLATGELQEDSLVFKVFYASITRGICEIKDVRLWSIAKASMAAKSVLQESREQRLWTEINKSSPEVKKVLYDFFGTMMEIAIANSPLLVLFIRMGGDQMVSGVVRYISRLRIFIKGQQRYDVYRYFDRRHDRLAT